MLKHITLMLLFGSFVACSTAPKIHHAPRAKVGTKHIMPMLLHSNNPQAHAVHGIDVSKYQGDIDWHAVRGDNIRFAYIKATEGGDVFDNKFNQNWQNAKEAGIKRGAYHFVYWCRSLSEQADWFIKNVPKDPDALPPVLDVEWNGHSPTCPKRLSKEVAQNEMAWFLHKVEKHYGKRPVIYADISFHKDVLSGGEFAEYPFWIRSVKYPIQEKYPGRAWSFWQYTATGKVAGIKGNVDRNVFAGEPADWSRLVAMNFVEQPKTSIALQPEAPVLPKAFVANEPLLPLKEELPTLTAASKVAQQ
jgi:lysozyme